VIPVPSITKKIHLTAFQRSVLIGMCMCITSQLYFSGWAEGFRLSSSAIFFPVLLMTLKRESHRPDAGLTTALCVIVFRVIGDLLSGIGFAAALMTEYPGGVFYLCYDGLFCLLLKDRRSVSNRRIWFSIFCCDLLSNIVNYVLSSHLVLSDVTDAVVMLVWMALFRSVGAILLLWTMQSYHQLLIQQEHEQRYRRLFLMTANLKSELYFLKKDAEEVEQVMAHAYKLYEQLERQDVPEELCALALSIARDVHEIKKDNLRIIRGLEEEVAETYDHEVMSMRDLLDILAQSTRQVLGQQRSEIRLECTCGKDLNIREHYRILSVLKNLVTNAVEAIQSASGHGCVRTDVAVEGETLIMTVSDNGPGISPRKQKLLFKVGYSTKFDPSTGNISRGVGLPAVQYIIEELGGTLSVTSQPGEGTCFRVELPVQQVTGGEG
jgi:two-component system sensor histidine kinase YcbA